MQLVRTVKENDHDLEEQHVNTLVIRHTESRNTLHGAVGYAGLGTPSAIAAKTAGVAESKEVLL